MTAKIETYSRYTKSGKKKKDREFILEVIRNESDLHRIEISQRTGIKESTVTARIKALRNEGKVFVSGTRKHGKNAQSTYRAIFDTEMQLLQRLRIAKRNYYDHIRTMLSNDKAEMKGDTEWWLITERNRVEPEVIKLDKQFNTLTQKYSQQ